MLAGIIFCVLQSFGESFIGIFFITILKLRDVNSEGMLLYAIIRIVLTIPFYLFIFPLVRLITNRRIPISYIALVTNIGVIVYFYNIGMIKRYSELFLVISLITSGILLFLDWKFRTKEFLKERI